MRISAWSSDVGPSDLQPFVLELPFEVLGVDRAALALRRLGEADRILRVPAARFGLAAEHDATDALPFEAVLERTLGLQFAIGIAEDDIGSVSCNLARIFQ